MIRKYLKQINKFKYWGLLLGVVGFFFNIKTSYAGVGDVIGNTAVTAATWTVSTLLYAVGYFFSKLLVAAGYILNWALVLNSNILDNPAVQVGWTLTRDIANLGFIFVIIFIAFGTILRVESLKIKKLLPSLIIAALLINFSLLIAAVVLDFSGILMNFFFNSAYTSSGGDGGIAMALTGAMNVHGFLKTPDINATTFTAFSAASLNYLASLLFLVIATIIGAITILAIGFMFLVRYIIIGFLLIMLPAAILMWVVKGDMKDWTAKFFQYTFFGPLAGFYIYIALRTSQIITTLTGSQLSQVINQDTSGVISNISSYLGSMIIMVAMLIYGLNLAQEQCKVGGKQAVEMAKGIAKSWTAFGLGGATRILTGGQMGYQDVSKKLADLGKPDKQGRIPWYRGLTRPLRQLGESGKDLAKTYGGGLNLPGNVLEEISTGLGSTSRKFRLKEEKKIKEDAEKKAKEAEKKAKMAKKELELQQTQKQLNDLRQQKLKIQEEIRQANIGFRPDSETKTASLQKQLTDIDSQIETINKTETETRAEINVAKDSDIDKLKEEVKELKEKGEESKGGEKPEKK